MGSALGGRAATYGANVGQSLLTGGINAARTTQNAAGSGLGLGLMQLGRSPEFTSGIANAFGDYTMNRNIAGALPTSARPLGGASQEEMNRMSYGYY
jgi:hypothetical protein